MFPVNVIHEKAVAAGLEYLLIGGHALNAYGTPRATLDVDFLVRREDQQRWRELLSREGFQLQHDGGNFLQLSPPYGVEWPLDLMLVAEDSFRKIWTDSRKLSCLGVTTRVPGPLHFIALKLHALTHGPASRKAKDFGDILTLSREITSPTESAELREIFLKFSNETIYGEFQQALGNPDRPESGS
jgi:hypothetical protein